MINQYVVSTLYKEKGALLLLFQIFTNVILTLELWSVFVPQKFF